LYDGVVGGNPIGDEDPVISVVEADERPVRNLSGYYLFFDLPQSEITISVDGGETYRDRTKTVNLAPNMHDPGDAVELSLDPTTSYPFPPGLTRVRGTVRNNGTPVPGATVSVTNHPQSFETTEDGEFVYYFNNIDHADIERINPDPSDPNSVARRLYKPGGTHPEFHADGTPGSIQRPIQVEVGTLTTTDINY
jgi:hypothetical protein